MNSRPPRYETTLYLLAILLALGLRFVRLGELPLTDSEARLALDALHIVKGQQPALSSHVAYTNLTAILFFIFDSTNFLARFLPALFGAAIVAVPFLFRDLIKPRPAVILAFLFAIDPSFVAASRQAGSPILALTCFLLAAGFWFRRQSVPAGVFLALALLSGASLWAGLLGLLLAWMLTQFMAARPSAEVGDEGTQVHTYTGIQVPSEIEEVAQPLTPTTQYAIHNTQYATLITDHRSLITALLATLLAASTLFLLSPQGLGAWLASLPEYFKGWVSPVSVPASRLFLALGVYQLFGILFALAAIVRGWWNMGRRVIRLSLWMLVALLLAAFYPARQTADLVWALVPLWTLAALELSRHLELVHDEDRLEIIGVFVFTIILLTLAWMSFNTLANNPSSAPYMLSFWGSLILLLLSLILVAFGWSTRIARVGANWGVAIMLGIYTLGAAWGGMGLRRDAKTVDLWDSSPRPAQADLLLQTLDETSKMATGQTDSLAVTVQGLDSPSLLWSLRTYDLIVVPALDPASAPDVVITPLRDDLGLAAAYRGQDFAWRASPIWDALASNYLRWLAYRELPSTNETIILWVRNDLFPDAEQ